MRIFLLLTQISLIFFSICYSQLTRTQSIESYYLLPKDYFSTSQRPELEEFYLGEKNINNPTSDTPEKAPKAYTPGMSISIPLGYVSSWGNISYGAGIIDRPRYNKAAIAFAGLAVGFGNPDKYFGGSISSGAGNLLKEPSAFGSVNLSVGRHWGDYWGVSLGAYDLISWSKGTQKSPNTFYAALSKITSFRSHSYYFKYIKTTLGLGNGAFLEEGKYNKLVLGTGSDSVNAFAGIAVNILPYLNAIADWTGQELDAGFSISPYPGYAVNLAAHDLLGIAGDGTRFSANFGASIQF